MPPPPPRLPPMPTEGYSPPPPLSPPLPPPAFPSPNVALVSTEVQVPASDVQSVLPADLASALMDITDASEVELTDSNIVTIATDEVPENVRVSVSNTVCNATGTISCSVTTSSTSRRSLGLRDSVPGSNHRRASETGAVVLLVDRTFTSSGQAADTVATLAANGLGGLSGSVTSTERTSLKATASIPTSDVSSVVDASTISSSVAARLSLAPDSLTVVQNAIYPPGLPPLSPPAPPLSPPQSVAPAGSTNQQEDLISVGSTASSTSNMIMIYIIIPVVCVLLVCLLVALLLLIRRRKRAKGSRDREPDTPGGAGGSSLRKGTRLAGFKGTRFGGGVVQVLPSDSGAAGTRVRVGRLTPPTPKSPGASTPVLMDTPRPQDTVENVDMSAEQEAAVVVMDCNEMEEGSPPVATAAAAGSGSSLSRLGSQMSILPRRDAAPSGMPRRDLVPFNAPRTPGVPGTPGKPGTPPTPPSRANLEGTQQASTGSIDAEILVLD